MFHMKMKWLHSNFLGVTVRETVKLHLKDMLKKKKSIALYYAISGSTQNHLKIYIFISKVGWQRGKGPLCAGSLPKWLQHSGPGPNQIRILEFIQVSPMDDRVPSIWTIIGYCLQWSSKELDWKQSIWDLNQCWNMGYHHCKWGHNLLPCQPSNTW